MNFNLFFPPLEILPRLVHFQSSTPTFQWMVQVGSPAPIFSEEVPIFESLMLSKNSSPKRQSFDSFKGSSDWLLEKTELKRIEETWEKVVLVLEREPVTKSLVQQKVKF